MDAENAFELNRDFHTDRTNPADTPLHEISLRSSAWQSAGSAEAPAALATIILSDEEDNVLDLIQEIDPDGAPYAAIAKAPPPRQMTARVPERANPARELTVDAGPEPEEPLPAVQFAQSDLERQLTDAREIAEFANHCQDRTNHALYRAIGGAYDLALAAADAPAEFEELLVQAGLKAKSRSPMTPVVKLVFGDQYNKTRLAEYAAALEHARRLQIGQDSLWQYLLDTPGGLKAVVTAERRLRREESGKLARIGANSLESLAGALRSLPACSLGELDSGEGEFALILVRRMPEGELAPVGMVPRTGNLLEGAASALIRATS